MSTVSWLDKPRGNWWTKEAVSSVVQANVSKELEVDGVTQMMVAAYKQWKDVEDLLQEVDAKSSGLATMALGDPFAEIRKRHEKYGAKIQEAAAWRAGMLEAKAGT